MASDKHRYMDRFIFDGNVHAMLWAPIIASDRPRGPEQEHVLEVSNPSPISHHPPIC